MKPYVLSDTVSGTASPHTVNITHTAETVTFSFAVKTAAFCLPYAGYNTPLYEGDVVEVFLSPEGDRSRYIEVELSPAGDLFLAYVHNTDQSDAIELTYVDRVDCFIVPSVQKTPDGYAASITFPRHIIGEEARFNAYVISREHKPCLFAMFPTGVPRFHRPHAFGRLKDYLK